jgi:hypothetical protein
MPRPDEEQFLTEVLLGNRDAVRFCSCLFHVSQVIDDLIDQDKQITARDIERSYWDAMIEIPSNPFYQRHIQTLVPLMQTAFNDWLDANDLEYSDDHGKNIAFVLRDSVGSIACQVAYLVGGFDHMRSVSMLIRRHIFEESLTDYKEGLK